MCCFPIFFSWSCLTAKFSLITRPTVNLIPFNNLACSKHPYNYFFPILLLIKLPLDFFMSNADTHSVSQLSVLLFLTTLKSKKSDNGKVLKMEISLAIEQIALRRGKIYHPHQAC